MSSLGIDKKGRQRLYDKQRYARERLLQECDPVVVSKYKANKRRRIEIGGQNQVPAVPVGTYEYGSSSLTHERDEAECGSVSCSFNNFLNSSIQPAVGGHLSALAMPLLPIPDESYILPDERPCQYCGAFRFHRESKSFCCLEGKIRLACSEPPPELVYLLTSDEPDPVSFRTYIRTYNSVFSFTSLGVTFDGDLCKRNNGVYTFRVQGQIYHYIDELVPSNGSPSYLQLYFYDTDHELENRLSQSERVKPSVVALIMSMLQSNPYAVFLRSLASLPDLENQTIIIKNNAGLDQRVYNRPSVSQVAAIWPENGDSDTPSHRDIVVHTHQNSKHRVNYFFGCYDPLQYPILFPHGENGWHTGIRRVQKECRSEAYLNDEIVDVHGVASIEEVIAAESKVLERSKKLQRVNVSAREYYCYKFQMRKDSPSLLLRCGRLFQQFVIDIYRKLETSRLDFFRLNQKLIRAELYEGLVDGITRGETRGDSVGRRVILPATFIGGPRDMCRRFTDAMTCPEIGVQPVVLTFWNHIVNQECVHLYVQRLDNPVIAAFKAAKEFESEIKKEPDSVTEPPGEKPTAVIEEEKQDTKASSTKESL